MLRHESVGSERLAHLTDHEIDRYAYVRGTAEETHTIEQHIAACVKCLQRLKTALRRTR